MFFLKEHKKCHWGRRADFFFEGSVSCPLKKINFFFGFFFVLRITSERFFAVLNMPGRHEDVVWRCFEKAKPDGKKVLCGHMQRQWISLGI